MRLPPEAARAVRFLIPDTVPLSLLGMIGPTALDWLFLPGAEVWVTDMVREEATRDPEPDRDQRIRHRADIRAWLARNEHRIRTQPTTEGEKYRNAMALWERAGRPSDLKPAWHDRGERSVLEVLDAAGRAVEDGEAVIVITDDGDARAALKARKDLDIDLMGTESFIDLVADEHGVVEAATAWQAIAMAANGKVPVTDEDDPVYVRRGP